jgi:hypothetical protein
MSNDGLRSLKFACIRSWLDFDSDLRRSRKMILSQHLFPYFDSHCKYLEHQSATTLFLEVVDINSLKLYCFFHIHSTSYNLSPLGCKRKRPTRQSSSSPRFPVVILASLSKYDRYLASTSGNLRIPMKMTLKRDPELKGVRTKALDWEGISQ